MALKTPLPEFSDVARFGTLLDSTMLPMLVTGVAGVAGFNAFAWFRQNMVTKSLGSAP